MTRSWSPAPTGRAAPGRAPRSPRPLSPDVAAAAVGVAVAASVAVVAAMWLRTAGAAFDDLTALGRLTGLVAADLLLVQVVFMARVPWLERAVGRDRLASWHRFTGFVSFDLMLAHVVLTIAGYAGAERTDLLREAWQLIVTYPGMLLAAAATVALCLAVVTSVRRARARLRYASWHLLHLYAYLGVGLALPHELWTGADFLTSPPATAYWWTIYVGAAGCVVVFRIAAPLWRSLRHRVEPRAGRRHRARRSRTAASSRPGGAPSRSGSTSPGGGSSTSWRCRCPAATAGTSRSTPTRCPGCGRRPWPRRAPTSTRCPAPP